MEALVNAIRSAISATGDYGIWIGILAFIMVLGYGMRRKEEKPKVQNPDFEAGEFTFNKSKEYIRGAQRETIGCFIILGIIAAFIIWLLI